MKPKAATRLVVEAVGALLGEPSEDISSYRVPSGSCYGPTVLRLAEDFTTCLELLSQLDMSSVDNHAADALFTKVTDPEWDLFEARNQSGDEIGYLAEQMISINDALLGQEGRKPIESKNVFVAVDGSRMSYIAMGVGIHLRGHGQLILGHVEDPFKDYLPAHLKAEYLQFDLDSKCTAKGVPKTSLAVTVQAKEEGQGTRESVLELASQHGADMLILGSFGLKGPSIFQTGSVTDWSVRCSPITTVIVKPTSRVLDVEKGEAATFVVAVDGSAVADKAVVTALTVMKPADEIVLVHIGGDRVKGNSPEQVKMEEEYLERLDRASVKGSFFLEEKIQGKTIAEQICEFSAARQCDYLVCGVDGMAAMARGSAQSILGSVTDAIIQKVKCTTVVCKSDDYYADA